SFASVDHWVRTTRESPPVRGLSEQMTAFSLLSGPLEPGWTEWEPRPGVPVPNTLVLFDGAVAKPLGYCLAGFWLLPIGWTAFRLQLAAFFRLHVVVIGL